MYIVYWFVHLVIKLLYIYQKGLFCPCFKLICIYIITLLLLQEMSALCVAAFEGQLEVVKLLLSRSADVNYRCKVNGSQQIPACYTVFMLEILLAPCLCYKWYIFCFKKLQVIVLFSLLKVKFWNNQLSELHESLYQVDNYYIMLGLR